MRRDAWGAGFGRCVVVGVACVAVACGGESRAGSEPGVIENSMPTPSATSSSEPGSTSTPSSTATSTPSPPATNVGDESAATGCPEELLLDIDPKVDQLTESGAITIEPLQEPDFSNIPPYDFDAGLPDQNPDPATWDRSDLPAGACVFRLYGVQAGCYSGGGIFFTDSCSTLKSDRGVNVAPSSFYDTNTCTGVAPGCPSADPYEFEPGSWWYLVPRSDDVTDLVICAPECASSFYLEGGCLRLRPTAAHTCR
jgi:hypothetical protein